MDRTWTIIRREYLERVRSKWFLISTVIAPLLFGLILVLPLWVASRMHPSADLARITIIDASGSGLGKRVAGELSGGASGDTAHASVVETTGAGIAAAERDAAAALASGRTKGYLVLDSATLGRYEARYVGVNASSEIDVDQLRRVVRDQVMALRLERAGVDPVEVHSLVGRELALHAERPTQQGRGVSGRVSSLFAFAVALLFYLSIFLYGQNVMRGVIEEKQSRVAEMVVSSVSATKLLAGKVLGVGAVGITQLVLVALASLAMWHIRQPLLSALHVQTMRVELPSIAPGQAALLVVYFLLGYVFYAALFAAVGSLVSTEHDAQQVQLPVAMLLVLSALFIQPVMLAPDSALAQALSVIPFSAPIIVPLRLSLVSLSTLQVVLSVASLAAGCYVTVWLAAKIYRTGLLMYGKRPRIAEVVRWLGHAP